MTYITFVGLDVHKDSITVALARSGKQNVEDIGKISNDPTSVMGLIERYLPKIFY